MGSPPLSAGGDQVTLKPVERVLETVILGASGTVAKVLALESMLSDLPKEFSAARVKPYSVNLVKY